MYGTVMVGRRRGAVDDFEKVNREWLTLRVPGFVKEETLVGDDGQTIVSVVFFESKEAYQRLANDPAQDAFWRERLAPLLDGEPQWFDGTWLETLHSLAV
jgi:heme-degrading monooxygenase HmoA